MATKKKTETWPRVEKGSHLTVTIHENGKRDLEWDDDALRRDVQAAIAKAESVLPVSESKATAQPAAKKYTRKTLAELTKAQLEEVGRGFGVELDRRKKKDDLIEDVMKAQRKANK